MKAKGSLSLGRHGQILRGCADVSERLPGALFRHPGIALDTAPDTDVGRPEKHSVNWTKGASQTVFFQV
ncbi:hypothetical protein GCM10025876_24880 [Demequina litorisediminis]|uniref:Uncharacterized protein n=1 Tax=Demequina litorisediminis TaxID=1849022 RepID=A0ABQ6IHU0_9MICO|nr:hypothetical protein GCM10025876_24880 [Demequina litorisediminis]